MEKRELGRSGITIAPLDLGGNVFGWTANRERSFALLDHFTGRGFNAVDTADVYSSWAPSLSGGESETVIGAGLARRKRRDDVVLMTKVGMWQDRKGLSAANIGAALDDSLRRLNTDYVDVYFAHIDDSDVPLAERFAPSRARSRRARSAPSAPRTIRRIACARRWPCRRRRACPAMRSCSPATTCMTGRNSRMRFCPSSGAKVWARSALFRWPADSSPTAYRAALGRRCFPPDLHACRATVSGGGSGFD